MSDPSDYLVPVLGAGGVGAVVMRLLTWSGTRNVSGLDESIKALNTTIAQNTKELQSLREAFVGAQKDIGALQEGHRSLEKRIDGQGSFWHQQFEQLRAAVYERMTKALNDVDQVVAKKKRGT